MIQVDHLVILAGGRATRLGPVTATMSKALVTVGSQPMLVRQINGIPAERVTVVVSASSQRQVIDLIKRTYGELDFRTVVQDQPRGPVDALMIGLSHGYDTDTTAIIMADSLYDFEDLEDTEPEYVACVPCWFLDERRSFCWAPHDLESWYDDDGWLDYDAGRIFTGLIYTRRPALWLLEARRLLREHEAAEGELGMASLLSAIRPQAAVVKWHDTGDIPALAATIRDLFIHREHHGIRLDDAGRIRKTGCTREQVIYARNREAEHNPLFPRLYDAGRGEITAEYVDLPSLAELWLYWPATDDVWRHIISRLLDSVRDHLWSRSQRLSSETYVGAATEMLVTKLLRRVGATDYVGTADLSDLLMRLTEVIQDPGRLGSHGLIHGDLNMTNVLYSARTDTFKLLDPRGGWGNDTGVGALLYDVAKLRYSWRGFVDTVHGLEITDERRRRGQILDGLLVEKLGVDLRDVAAVEASIFLSAPPLHPEAQRPALVRHGLACLEEALS